MILGEAMADAGGAKSHGPTRQTKPILAVFGLKMRVAWKTKPIGAAGGRDWGLRIADWGFANAGHGASGAQCAKQSQFASLGYIGAAGGRDWGLRIRRRQMRDTRYASRDTRGGVSAAPNKANFRVFELKMEVP
jgi:hypothetical protein